MEGIVAADAQAGVVVVAVVGRRRKREPAHCAEGSHEVMMSVVVGIVVLKNS